MNTQRRRANDFTDSLNSFRQVSEEQNESVFETCSVQMQGTDSIKNEQCEDNDHNATKNDAFHAGSIILAGNFARQQSDSFKTIQDNYINTHKDGQPISEDILTVSDETSYLSIKPDLNKCIDLFNNEYLKEYDVSRKYLSLSSSLSELRISKDIELNKNNSPRVQLIRDCRRSMSANSLKSTTQPNIEIRKCKSCTMLNNNLKRDTNYNIKSDKLFLAETVTKSNQDRDDLRFVSLYDKFSLPQTPILQKEPEKWQEPDSSAETSLKEELNPSELRAFLRSLDQKPTEAPNQEPNQERFLRRLSITYYDSPKYFTEKLLTIIEESTESQANVSLCRLLEEFQKCNYIEDETAPEWLHSSPGMSIRMRKGSQEFKRDILRKSLGATPNKDYSTTPISPRLNINSPNKIYRRPKSILYNVGSPQLDNTSTFESLEAYCEKLYPNEYKTLVTGEKNPWQSPLRNKNRILRACENQMASLENSPNIYDQLKQAGRSTSDSISQRNTVPDEALCRLLSHEQCDKTDLKNVPDILKQRTKHDKRYERIKQDNLRHSLIHEIAKKRQKCIDTVKMMESDADSESMGAQEICQITTKSECNSSTINDAKFMKTLKCVKRYQDYLEQYKPLLNLLQQSESYNSHTYDTNDTPTKKMPKENFNTDITVTPPSKTLRVPKSSTTRKKSPSSLKSSSTNKVIVSKPKLFYTPGKTTAQAVVKNCKPKRTYFPNLLKQTSKQKENVSPQENIYRQIGTYDYVKSPVASYIRGTDPYLVKNLRPKTDENLLTPRKKQANRSPSKKSKMKFRLSPKEESTRRPVRDEDTADNFLYPKVNYKLPSHVRTIKEKENLKVGNRVNQLLRSTQDKIVIRHEGRTKSVQTDCSEQPEIHYDSAEESVHIEQTARKTCFCRMQKN